MLEQEDEKDTMLEKLNSLWIDSYKIRAFLPRFDRGEARLRYSKDKPETKEKLELKTEPEAVPEAFVEKGRSFANVVLGRSDSGKNCHMKSITFIPTEEEKEWLINAKVRLLNEDVEWEECGGLIMKAVEEHLLLKYMGEGLILMTEVEGPPILGSGIHAWEKDGFRWVRPWKEQDVCQRRIVWTAWYGVPIHAWSERFFRQVSLTFGSFLEWDENARNKTRLDVAKIKIWGYSTKQIIETISILIEGKEFSIRIVERMERQIGSGTIPERGILESGNVAANFEGEARAADLVGMVLCGSKDNKKHYAEQAAQEGSTKTLELPPRWGPPEKFGAHPEIARRSKAQNWADPNLGPGRRGLTKMPKQNRLNFLLDHD